MSTLFFSYSHEDEGLRDRLDKHLTMLKRQGAISAWHDRRIVAGDALDKRIDEHLEQDDIILLLVSADFLASEYCYGVEVQRAMERHASGSARVIPVILKPCDWKSAPFGNLLAAPKDAKPITTWTNEDEAFLDVVRQIREALPGDVAASGCSSAISAPESIELPATKPVIRSSNLRLRKSFTDADRDRFLEEAFELMARFFENSLAELERRNDGIEGRFRRLDAAHFSAVIYQSGATQSQCTITLGGSFGRGITYSNSVGRTGNSFNEMLSVESDDEHQFLKPLGVAMMGNNCDHDGQLSFEGAAEYFWALLIAPLQH